MSDMKTEQLQPGQGPAGLGEGEVTPRLGFNHAENVAAGGGAMYLRGLAEGEHGASQFEAAPQVEHAGGQAEMGGGGDAIETEIIKELQKYEGNWTTKTEADKNKLFPAWEMVLKAKLGSESAKKWCQDNRLSLELHGEVFRRLAAKRREEKMTAAERAQGLTGEFLIFREVLPHMLNNKELVDQRTILAPQQGGQNAAKP